MKHLPPTELDALHMTRPQQPTDDTSVWPAVAAIGLLLVVVGLTVWALLAVAGALVVALAIWGVGREVNPPDAPARAAQEPARAAAADFWRDRPKHVWLGLGFVVTSTAMLAAIVRSWLAYDLFLPTAWAPVPPPAATPLLAAATMAIAASLLLAHLGARSFSAGRAAAGKRQLIASAVLGAAFVGSLATHAAGTLGEGATSLATAAGSLHHALLSFHILTATAGLLLLTILGAHAAVGRLEGKRDDALRGALAYWWFVGISWLATFLAVHLRLLVIDAPDLI